MGNFRNLFFSVQKKLKSQVARKGYIVLIDQCVVSAVTFLTSILLARFLNLKDYGIFVLAYAILLFMNTIQEAVVIKPMMVLNASLDGIKLRQYMTSTAFSQLLLGSAIVFLILGASVVSRLCFLKYDFAQICLFLAFVTFAFQSQEFFRRILFARMNFIGGFINDLIGYGLQIIGILFLVCTKQLSTINAFSVIATSFMIAAFIGWFQCRIFLTINIFGFKDVVIKNWTHGKWLLSSNMALWVSGQFYLFVTAFFIGPAGPAILKACQNIIAPTHIVLQSLENLLSSPASRKLRTEGLLTFKRFLKTATKVVLALIVPYCVLVSLYSEGFLKLFYGNQYEGYGIVVILITARYIASSFNRINMIGLRVLHRPSSIFYAYLFASILTIIISIPLVKYFGVIGSAIGALLSGITVFLINRRSFKQSLAEIS